MKSGADRLACYSANFPEQSEPPFKRKVNEDNGKFVSRDEIESIVEKAVQSATDSVREVLPKERNNIMMPSRFPQPSFPIPPNIYPFFTLKCHLRLVLCLMLPQVSRITVCCRRHPFQLVLRENSQELKMGGQFVLNVTSPATYQKCVASACNLKQAAFSPHRLKVLLRAQLVRRPEKKTIAFPRI